jgi:hypothetical protein
LGRTDATTGAIFEFEGVQLTLVQKQKVRQASFHAHTPQVRRFDFVPTPTRGRVPPHDARMCAPPQLLTERDM